MRKSFPSRPTGSPCLSQAVTLIDRVSGNAVALLAVVTFSPLALLTRDVVRRWLLIVVLLNIPFTIGRHLFYREDVGNLGSIGGFGITVTTFALAGLYLPRLLGTRRPSVSREVCRRAVSIPLALYVFVSFLSLLTATDVTVALYELLLLAELLLLHTYIVSEIRSGQQITRILQWLMVGLTVEALLMIALAAGLAETGFIPVETRVDDQSPGGVIRQMNMLGIKGRIDENLTTHRVRVGGSVGSPNDAASYLAGACGIAMGLLLSSVSRRIKLLAGCGLSLGSIGVLLTGSRGGWFSLGIITAIIVYCSSRRGLVSWKIRLGIAVAFFLAAGTILSGVVDARLTEDDNGSAESRVPLMKLALLIIEDHPILGVGANNFPLAMQPYISRGFSGEFLYSVHNKYLLIWSEVGPVGLLSFAWFLIAAMRAGFRCWRLKDPLLSPIALSCSAVVAGEMFHMGVDIFRGTAVLELICVVTALAVVLESLAAPGRHFRHISGRVNMLSPV